VEDDEREPGADDAERQERAHRVEIGHRIRHVEQPERERDQRGHHLRPGHGRDRLHAAQVALQVPRAHGIAEGREDHEQAAHERLGPAPGVHAEQHPHSDDPDGHAREARRARALLAAEREGEQEGEDRCARHEDAGERRRDPLLTERDQGERGGHLDDREHHDRAEPPAQATQHAEPQGKRNQHERREGRSDRDDGPGRHAVVERDLDEQVRRAPERAEREQQGDGATRHQLPAKQMASISPNETCLTRR